MSGNVGTRGREPDRLSVVTVRDSGPTGDRLTLAREAVKGSRRSAPDAIVFDGAILRRHVVG
jgi:hypothetical protein